ncbi:hypothetical protein BH23ACT11_BH23ACT11_29230 [soil metagenome]
MAEKMQLTSEDISAERVARLREDFPEAFTEGKVDFERLKQALGEEVTEGRERYGLSWAGKSGAVRNIQTPSVATLTPDRDESVEFDATENLFIEGDNLEVLKLLQKSYHGRVKMIYIDPPYNTGNEFIYPDNFHEGIEDYLRYSGQTDGEGMKLSTNTETSGRYHSAWLNMMYPRLFLARNLLREDGVVFVSIDDHEVHNLRMLMDEIFGEENFIANIVWQKRYVSNVTAQWISDMHDHVLFYGKQREYVNVARVERTSQQLSDYKNPDQDPRGVWRAQDLSASKPYSAGQFTITTPAGKEVTPPPGRYWRCSEKQYNEWLEDNRIWFGKSGTGRPMLKAFLSESSQGTTPNTWWSFDFAGHNKEATLETKALFDGASPFDTPKPIKLFNRMLKLVTGEDDMILDFFAGSGTSAHAVLDLNREDSGNRKFIMVQLPEPTENPDYPTIADIGKERIRRVIEELNEEDEGQLKSGDEPPQDRGFKVFKLTSSNFKIWDGAGASEEPEDLAEQLRTFAENVQPDRSREDILYEILLKSGLPLTAEVERLEVAGREVYAVSGGLLVVCMEDHVDEELVRAVAELEPQRFVCLDAAFDGNDKLKTNAVLQMKDSGIEFRTV